MFSTVAMANPTVVNTNKANKLFAELENSQEDYLEANGKYEQIKKKNSNKYLYECDVYDGPEGKGYVLRVIKTFNKKIWVIEKHVGPETNRTIHTEWTKKEAYNL